MALIYNGEDLLEQPAIAHALDGVCVRDWHEHGMQFTNAEGGIRKLRRKPSIFTLHWTGGTGGAQRVFHTLKNRKTHDGKGLSVQLFADAEGTVWQYADLNLRARHASATNAFGPGLEVQGRGIDRTAEAKASTDENIHGRKIPVLPFTEPQYRAIVGLSVALMTAFELPLQCPGMPDGSGPYSGLMPRAAIHSFRGVLGHFHVSRHKLDPGLDVFRRLVRDGGFVYAPQR